MLFIKLSYKTFILAGGSRQLYTQKLTIGVLRLLQYTYKVGPTSRVCATKPHLVVIYNHRRSILIVDDKIDDLERLRGTFFEAGCAPKIEQSDNADKMKDWGRRTCSKETCCLIE